MKAYMYWRKSVIFSAALALFFIIIAFLTNITFPLVVLSTTFLYKVVPLPNKINHPIIRAIFTIVLLLSVFNIVGLLLDLIGLHVISIFFGVASVAITGTVFVTLSLINRLPTIAKISKFDILAIVPVLIGTIFFLIYMFGNNLSIAENLIRFMGSSSDQSAHLSMFNDILQNNGNYVYFTDKLSINTPGINSYPMGWHQGMATLSDTLFNVDFSSIPFTNILAMYFMCALLTFILYAASISAFTSLIYDKVFVKKVIGKERRNLTLLSEILIKTFIVLAVMFLFLYVAFSEFGYINFIYAACIVILFSILCLGLSKGSDIKVDSIILFTLLLFTAVESWYIMGLPLGIMFASLVFMYIKRHRIYTLGLNKILLFSVCFLLLSVAFLAVLYNVYTSGSGDDQLIIGNGPAAWLPNVLIIIGVLVPSIIIINRTKQDLHYVLVNGFFVSILLLTAWNFLNLQEYSYYQQKLLYAFFALCIPITFLSIIKYLHSMGVQTYLSIAIIVFVFYTINPVGIVSITKNIMRPTSDPEISIINEYFKSEFNSKTNTTFIRDYREDRKRPTEPYARLLLSKVVSPGDCYNQLVMPLISLGEQDYTEKKTRSVESDKIALRCYGSTDFVSLGKVPSSH